MAGTGSAEEKRFPRVGDALTLYAWRAPALMLVRWAAAAAVAPATFIAVESLLSLLVFASFWTGRYWAGLAVAVPVMILAAAGFIVDGPNKRLREPVAIGFPLFWWWGWAHGLPAFGRPLHPVYALMVVWVAVGGGIAIWAAEILSRRRFGMEVYAWRPFDTRFRLVSAARNTNLIILAAGLLFGRPDSGLVLVAWWTLITVITLAVRIAQMTERQARRLKVESWLEA